MIADAGEQASWRYGEFVTTIVRTMWVLASSALDIGVVSALAWSGTLMAPLPVGIAAAVFIAAGGFVVVLDQIKVPVMRAFKVG